MSFQVFQAQGLRIYAGDTATVNSYTGLPNELAINTETKSVRVLDGVTPGGVPLTTTSGAELQGLNIEQLANLLVTAPQNGQALVYQDGKWTNQPVAASGGASHVNDLVDVKLTNLQTGEILSYNASISKWENKAVAAADHNHDTKYQAKGNYLTTTSNLGEINNVQITMPADGQSLVYDEGYQKWINTTVAGGSSGSGISGSVLIENSPVGMIAPFAMETVPDEWLICDGSTLNSVTNPEYVDLFDAIGTTWGGTGASDFKVPDLRGEFLRGWDNGAGNDPDSSGRTGGDAVGSSQSYQIQSHTHSQSGTSSGKWTNNSGGDLVAVQGTQDVSSAGGSETRPRNVAVLYCIKYKAASGSGVSFPSEITDATNGEVLVYEDGKWVNQAAPETRINGITSVDGKIGIGTTDPLRDLHVMSSNNGAILVEGHGSGYTSSVFVTKSNGGQARGGGLGMKSSNADGSNAVEWYVGRPYSQNDNLVIARQTGSSDMGQSTAQLSNAIVTVDSSGKLGIGTSAPAKHLHVSGTSPVIRLTDAMATSETDGVTYLEFHQGSSDTRMGYVGYGSSGAKHLYLYNNLSGGYVYFRTTGSGRVRIQTDYGYADLGPTNSSYFHFLTDRPKFYFNKQCSAVSGFVTHSDERLKENITVVENAVDALKKIRGVSFTWKKNADSQERPEGKRFGVLAQEVLQIDPEMCELPEAVNDGDEKFYTFDYSNLTPYFIEAIKEQQATIESQQARIDSLEARLAALEAKLG